MALGYCWVLLSLEAFFKMDFGFCLVKKVFCKGIWVLLRFIKPRGVLQDSFWVLLGCVKPRSF